MQEENEKFYKKNSNTDIALKVFMEANNAPTDTYGGTLTAAAHRGGRHSLMTAFAS